MNIIQLAVSILMLSILNSCSNSNPLRFDKDIINGWDIEESIKFEINDTIDFYSNIFFFIRNNNDYPFSNIFLIAAAPIPAEKESAEFSSKALLYSSSDNICLNFKFVNPGSITI